MKVTEKYAIDKAHECAMVYKTTDLEHPGVKMVMEQGDVNLAGPIKVLSTGGFTEKYGEQFMTPAQTRALFTEMGWSKIAAFQTRNPMHRSHEYLAKVAIETCDGVLVHSLLGTLKPGDIPADVRTKAIGTLMEKYFVKKTVVQAGYPLDMRYAGPREALLHALFRQNYGCSHLIVGRDHAGVGSYYGPFDAHHIFDHLPKGSLETVALKIDWTFWCYKCGGMASARTCPQRTRIDRCCCPAPSCARCCPRAATSRRNFRVRRCWRFCGSIMRASPRRSRSSSPVIRPADFFARRRNPRRLFSKEMEEAPCQHSYVPTSAMAARVRTRPLACTSARTT